jgi:Xaa-Pro aminopeptidase
VDPVSIPLELDAGAEAEKARGRAPRPPAEEQEGRLARVRAAMERHELDGVLLYGSANASPEPIRYLAGYVHVFPGASSLLVISADRPPILLIDQAWHLEEAARMAFVSDVRAFPNPARGWQRDELVAAVGGAVRDAGLADGRLGVLGGQMPAVYREVLPEVASRASVAEAAAVWSDVVAAPSAYDAEMIRRTARIADGGLAAAVEAARAGVTEYEICLASLARMAAEGAEFLHGSGASTHINIGSWSDAVSNVRPYLFSTARLEDGQMFWLDLSASYDGYYIDSDRTISVGEPNAEQRRIYDVAAEMYDVMLAEARAGVPGGALWERANQVAMEAGLAEYGNHVYLGHTTGITTSTRPVVAPGEARELQAGSFVNVEPGIFVPGVGSACIENTLHVTESGATAINGFPIEIHVV